MKEAKLRKIISEEIRFLLSERFGSKRLQSLVNGMSKWEKRNFLQAGVKTGLDWNSITDADITRVAKTPAQLYGKQGIYLILALKDFDFKESGSYGWNRKIKKGQMIGMMVGGKVAYITKNGIGSKSTYGSSGKVGLDMKGARSVRGMSEMPHIVFQINYEDKKDALKDKQKMRANQKFGATAFQTPKQFKDANIARYKKALEQSADKGEKIHKMVLAAVAHSNKLVEKALKEMQLDRYGNIGIEIGGKIEELQSVTRLQDSILDSYSRYTSYDKQSKGEEGYGKEYYAEQRASYALQIKKYVNRMLKNNFNRY
tara:strand:+ start:9509 stop:10450 length:942 start_codon:yes stop_codon:yes gene_type:complete